MEEPNNGVLLSTRIGLFLEFTVRPQGCLTVKMVERGFNLKSAFLAVLMMCHYQLGLKNICWKNSIQLARVEIEDEVSFLEVPEAS